MSMCIGDVIMLDYGGGTMYDRYVGIVVGLVKGNRPVCEVLLWIDVGLNPYYNRESHYEHLMYKIGSLSELGLGMEDVFTWAEKTRK